MVALAPQDLILDVSRWPLYPILPLDHLRESDGAFPKPGVMIACVGYELIVFHCNMYDLKNPADALTFPRTAFDSLSALKSDWRVA